MRALLLRALRLHVVDPDDPQPPENRRARPVLLTGLSLASLDDVVITDPQDGDVITFDSDAGVWVNAAAETETG